MLIQNKRYKTAVFFLLRAPIHNSFNKENGSFMNRITGSDVSKECVGFCCFDSVMLCLLKKPRFFISETS